MKGIFVTGTDTNVGKTWIGVRLIQRLVQRNIAVIPRKPVESGWDDNIQNTDAWQLASASNRTERLDEICPNRFKEALSPARAAKNQNSIITIENLFEQCIQNTEPHDFLFVEGAGGFYSPLASDGLNADLAKKLNLPVVLIAENRLGCINQVLLNVAAIEKAGLSLAAVVLNQINVLDENESNSAMFNQIDVSRYIDVPLVAFESGNKQTQLFNTLAKIVFER